MRGNDTCDRLAAVSNALIVEFASVPEGTVVLQVQQAGEQLFAAGVRAGLATAAEAMARLRLQHLSTGTATGVAR